MRARGEGDLQIPPHATIIPLSSDLVESGNAIGLHGPVSSSEPSSTDSTVLNETFTESNVSDDLDADLVILPLVIFNPPGQEVIQANQELDMIPQGNQELIGYESDVEEYAAQPRPLAIDASSMAHRLHFHSCQGETGESSGTEQGVVSGFGQLGYGNDVLSLANSGGMYSPPGCSQCLSPNSRLQNNDTRMELLENQFLHDNSTSKGP